MKKLFSLVLCVLILLSFTGCKDNDSDNKKVMEVGYWEKTTVTGSYTLDSLALMSIEELENLKNKYVSVEFELNSISVKENIYYMNNITSITKVCDNSQLYIYALSYQNYWDIPFIKGDIIIVEGFVEKYEGYGESPYRQTITITPCEAKKK